MAFCLENNKRNKFTRKPWWTSKIAVRLGGQNKCVILFRKKFQENPHKIRTHPSSIFPRYFSRIKRLSAKFHDWQSLRTQLRCFVWRNDNRIFFPFLENLFKHKNLFLNFCSQKKVFFKFFKGKLGNFGKTEKILITLNLLEWQGSLFFTWESIKLVQLQMSYILAWRNFFFSAPDLNSLHS